MPVLAFDKADQRGPLFLVLRTRIGKSGQATLDRLQQRGRMWKLGGGEQHTRDRPRTRRLSLVEPSRGRRFALSGRMS